MASITVQSGTSGVNPALVAVQGTADTLLLMLPYDLKLILETFKSTLAIDSAHEEFFPEWTGDRTIMLEIVGGSIAHGKSERLITIDFHILKLRAPISGTPEAAIRLTETARYTLHRLIRLLAVNGNFNCHCGLNRLVNLDYIQGTAYTNQFESEHGNNIDGALLTATYSATNPELISTY